MNILLAIKGNIFEVSQFVLDHPGEGICGMYLQDHNRQEVTPLFEKYHTSNIPDFTLLESISNQYQSILHLGPYYFQRRIPRYYHYIYNIKRLKTENLPNKSYLLYQSDNKKELTINLFVKDAMGMISVHNLNLVINNEQLEKCYVKICDSIDDNNDIVTATLEETTIEGFIDKYFKKEGYTPILKPEFKN